nr:uncharacterized protein LOC111424495 [Onthophagus taurus]
MTLKQILLYFLQLRLLSAIFSIHNPLKLATTPSTTLSAFNTTNSHDINVNLTNTTNHTRIPGYLTDLNLCKLTHLGLDYVGRIGKSESGVRCQSWTTKTPVHRVDPKFTDDNFSDFSRVQARYYCRNPNREETGPWCYTMDPDNIWETCGVPLCSYSECRITGPGMEYAGTIAKSFKDKKCVRWNKNRPKLKVNNEIISINQYNNDLFPDETVRDAKKTCRNPDGDIGGPWCFVETIDKKIVEKQYCDVPYCNEESCMVFTKSSPIYNHYMSFPNDLINFTFGAKLWDPDSYLNSSAKLVLSLYPLPLSSQQINDLAIGVEIFLSNKKSAFTVGVNDIEYVKTLGLLKSNKFIYFSLTWWHNIITLTIEGGKKPLLMADIKNKDTLLNYKMNQFFYFSAIGNNILWEFPFCDVEEQCDVHTTTSVDFQKFFPIRDVMQGQEINFNIRAYHSAYVLLVATPAKDYPQFKIILQREGNITRVLYKPHEKASEAVLHEVFGEIVQYWTWKEFTIHLFGDEFEVFTSKKGLANTFISFKHDDLRLMRWFSIGSDNTIAHWTLYCFPPKEASPPAAYLPECALTRSEIYYNGTQDVTSDGFPCLPWAGQKIMPIDEIDTLFNNVQQKLQVSNYCRDPKDEQKGAFCYVIQQGIIKKQYCRIRKCKSAECKMAGTGNDYIGKMSVTRSNRTCQHWLSPAQMRSLIENEAKAKESPPETPNLLEHNITSIADMVKHLQALNQYFDDNSCDNKWRCLRGLFERRLIKKSVENVVDNPVKNSDQYANESKSPPHQEEVMKLETELAKNKIINKIVQEEETQTSVYDYIYIHTLAPVFINETLYADMDLLAIKNYCRNPTRDVAGKIPGVSRLPV